MKVSFYFKLVRNYLEHKYAVMEINEFVTRMTNNDGLSSYKYMYMYTSVYRSKLIQ